MVGAGAGMVVGQATTLLSNLTSKEKFDRTDYMINTLTGATTGGLTGLASGPGTVLSAIRVGIGSLGAGIASEVSDAAHGRPVDVDKAQLVALTSIPLGVLGDKISSAFAGPSVARQPKPGSALAKEL